MTDPITIRPMQEQDCAALSKAFAQQGWHKPASQYQAYLRESAAGQRTALVAELRGRLAGYVTIVWLSGYPPFRQAGIPEIVDLNVLIAHQRQGVGAALLAAAEQRIAQRSPAAGIGVGLTADYGPAQRLYVRRGYVPDGRGLHAHGQPVAPNDTLPVADAELHLLKRLDRRIDTKE